MSSRLLTTLLLLSSTLLTKTSPAQDAPAPVQKELIRLAACHPVFKLAKPPIHARVVWTQPHDLTWKSDDPTHLHIDFQIQYAQSVFYKSDEEATKAQDFSPMFELPQRNEYEFTSSGFRLIRSQSFKEGKWIPADDVPEFSCWRAKTH